MTVKWITLPLTLLLFFMYVCPAESLQNNATSISSSGKVVSAARALTSTSTPSTLNLDLKFQTFFLFGMDETTVDNYGYSAFFLSEEEDLQALEQKNSDYLTLQYYNPRCLWTSGASQYDAGKYNTFVSNDWILYWDAARTIPVSKDDALQYFADIGNPSVQQWYADLWADRIETWGFDGMCLDNVGWSMLAFYGYPRPEGYGYYPHNPRTGTMYGAEITDDYQNLIDTFRAELDSRGLTDAVIKANSCYNGHTYFSNYVSYSKHLPDTEIDMFLSEGAFGDKDTESFISVDRWKETLDMLVDLEDRYENGACGEIDTVFLMSGFRSVYRYTLEELSLPSFLTEGEFENYTLCNLATRYLTIRDDGLDTVFGIGGYGMLSDLPKKLEGLDIGNPLGSYSQVGEEVWKRTFEGGVVMVNPTETAYTVTVGSGLIDYMRGTSVPSTITLSGHSGLFLKGT